MFQNNFSCFFFLFFFPAGNHSKKENKNKWIKHFKNSASLVNPDLICFKCNEILILQQMFKLADRIQISFSVLKFWKWVPRPRYHKSSQILHTWLLNRKFRQWTTELNRVLIVNQDQESNSSAFVFVTLLENLTLATTDNVWHKVPSTCSETCVSRVSSLAGESSGRYVSLCSSPVTSMHSGERLPGELKCLWQCERLLS